MHELEMVERIISLIADQAKEQGFVQVREATLTIGRMNGLDEEHFSTALSSYKEGPLAQTKLNIEPIPVLLICNSCGACFEDPRFHDRGFAHSTSHAPNLYLAPSCPECGNEGARVISGQEMKLISIEGE